MVMKVDLLRSPRARALALAWTALVCAGTAVAVRRRGIAIK